MDSQLTRIEIQSMAIVTLERILAHGFVVDDELAQMQKTLEKEASVENLLTSLRSARAWYHISMTNVVDSPYPLTSATAFGQASGGSVWDYIDDPLRRTRLIRSHAAGLRYGTKAITLAAKPASERYRTIQEFDKSFAKAKFPRWCSFYLDAAAFCDTRLHCAIVGQSAERFRASYGRWPKDMDELVANKYLASVPPDPFNGEQLRLRISNDGIVIYSVGKNGSYEGDALDHLEDIAPDEYRPEFRLWNLENRRLPPLANERN